MEYADYHVVYVDNRVTRDLDGKLIQNSSSHSLQGAAVSYEETWDDRNPECLKSILGEIEEVRSNLRNLLSVFNGGMIGLRPIESRGLLFSRESSILGTLQQLTDHSTHLHIWRYLHGQGHPSRFPEHQQSSSPRHAWDPSWRRQW